MESMPYDFQIQQKMVNVFRFQQNTIQLYTFYKVWSNPNSILKYKYILKSEGFLLGVHHNVLWWRNVSVPGVISKLFPFFKMSN